MLEQLQPTPTPKPIEPDKGGWPAKLIGGTAGVAVAALVEQPLFDVLEGWLDRLSAGHGMLAGLAVLALLVLVNKLRELSKRGCPICQGRELPSGLHCPNCQPQGDGLNERYGA